MRPRNKKEGITSTKSGRAARFGLAVAVLAVELTCMTPALAQSNAPSDNSYCDVHNGWNHMMGWGYGMYGGIGMLLFWGVIIVLLVFAARSFMGGRWSQPQPGSTALDILKERYAKGEIDKPEYEERRKMLMD